MTTFIITLMHRHINATVLTVKASSPLFIIITVKVEGWHVKFFVTLPSNGILTLKLQQPSWKFDNQGFILTAYFSISCFIHTIHNNV